MFIQKFFRNVSYIFLFAIFLLFLSCALEDTKNYVEGEDSEFNQLNGLAIRNGFIGPFDPRVGMITIIDEDLNYPMSAATGTNIAPRCVLTAAHIFTNAGTHPCKYSVCPIPLTPSGCSDNAIYHEGTWTISRWTKLNKPYAGEGMENWIDNILNDIAVVWLEENPNSNLSLMPLSFDIQDSTPGPGFKIVGYGSEETNSNGQDDGWGLQRWGYNILDEAVPNSPLPSDPRRYLNTSPTITNQLGCSGDSGSPLIKLSSSAQIGILHSGYREDSIPANCGNATGTRYVELAGFQEWIEEQIATFCTDNYTGPPLRGNCFGPGCPENNEGEGCCLWGPPCQPYQPPINQYCPCLHSCKAF